MGEQTTFLRFAGGSFFCLTPPYLTSSETEVGIEAGEHDDTLLLLHSLLSIYPSTSCFLDFISYHPPSLTPSSAGSLHTALAFVSLPVCMLLDYIGPYDSRRHALSAALPLA